ncbi:MAG: zinc ribbon domain-containing protein [Proteobacteria bacterium]|nr:zinc ribbon domain-containing protein [Pseudomonadota bacterium]
MPMYEYQCSKCEKRFEELITSSEDEAEIACSGCGSTKVFRVLSAFAKGRSQSSDHGSASSHSCSGGGGGRGSGGFS